MSETPLEIPEWITRIRHPTLFKAASFLCSVRNACQVQLEGSRTGAEAPFVGAFELRLLSEGVGALRELYGSWERLPLPSYSEAEASAYRPAPAAVLTYCALLLAHIERNLATLDRDPAGK